MSNHQTTRRSMLFGLATATTIGLAGCSQPDDDENATPTDSPESDTTVPGTEDDQVTPSETTDSTETETGDSTPTETENNLPDGVSYPEPGEPATEITLLETSDDYEVVLVDAYKNEKYIGDTMRIPEVGFVDDVEGYLYFMAYEEEEGRSPQQGIAVRPEDTEWTVDDFRENGTGVHYEIEGPLYAVESVGGGNVLVLGGDTVSITEQ